MKRPWCRARGLAASAVLILGTVAVSTQVRDYRPVTDAMLLNPDPADWLHFRRTLDGQGYSPLNQINRQNVHQLQVAWSWTLHHGTSEPTPLVSNGIMYLPNPGGGVQALDATNGDLLWDFPAPAPTGGASEGGEEGLSKSSSRAWPAGAPADGTRNLAIYGNNIYTATGRASGGRVIALNARTGEIVWDKVVGYRHTAGPIAVKGKIIVSTSGCERQRKDNPPCFIAALDAGTGQELWRTSTIARPGEPGGDSWGSLALMSRTGGENRQAGSYDPATNLTFWGTGAPQPTTRFQRGTDGDALYTNSTLALDVDTGKMVWYAQHLPGDSAGFDETFERVLADYDGRSSVFSMGELGILWEHDRKSGAFRSARDLGYQHIVTVDPKTGRVTYRPDGLPKPDMPFSSCPGANGVKNWRAMAYHPDTRAMYVPLTIHCEDVTYLSVGKDFFDRGGGAGPTKGRAYKFHASVPEGIGELAAMDVRTGRLLWRHRTRAAMSSAALTTGGGLALVGDADRNLYIHDATTGRILFRTRLSNAVGGFPITYAAGGRQYLAISASTGNAAGWADVAESVTPEAKFATNANTLHVFALPQRTP